jgi:hypothetical protein
MKNALFSQLKDRFIGLKPREKWLAIIALFFILFFLVDRILIVPFSKMNADLIAQTQEKLQMLSGIRNYVQHQEWQKDLYKGKASDFLNLFMKAAKDSRLELVRLKKTENSDKGILVRFEGDGNIRNILDFILKLEKMDFVVLFQKLDLAASKAPEYHFDGEIQVVKG